MDSPLLPTANNLPSLFDETPTALRIQDLSFDERPARQPDFDDSQDAYQDPDDSIDTPPRPLPPAKKAGPRFSLFPQRQPSPPPPPPPPPAADSSSIHPPRSTLLASSRSSRAPSGTASPVSADDFDAHDDPRREEEAPLHLDDLEHPSSPSERHASRYSVAGSRADTGGEEREASLRRTLAELEATNRAFEAYETALELTEEYHIDALQQANITNSLLDSYMVLLRTGTETALVLRDPTFAGAAADARMHAEQIALIAQQQAALQAKIAAEEEAERERGRKLAEMQAEAARVAALATSSGAGGRGGASAGARGVAHGRGIPTRARGGGNGTGQPTGIPTTSARGRTPSYAGVRSSGYGPPSTKKKAV